jgi:AcrR family transcriptional regulator
MGEKKSYHHPDLRRALLDAALILLREEGIKGFSLRKAAARAGVSHAAPYRHFSSKDDLIAALMLEGNRRLATALNAARDSTPGPAALRLMALGRAYLDFARENVEHLAIMFSGEGMSVAMALAAPPPGAVFTEYDSFAPLETTVRECQAEGSLDPEAGSGALAMATWSQIHGLALLRNEGVIGSMARSRGASEEEAVNSVLAIMERQLLRR